MRGHQELRELLQRVSSGAVSTDAALRLVGDMLAFEPVKHLAKLDALRETRTGFPEVVFGEGKELAHMHELFGNAWTSKQPLFATRVTTEVNASVCRYLESGLASADSLGSDKYRYFEVARIAALFPPREDTLDSSKTVSVLTGGTADLRVAEEAAVTLELTGIKPRRVFDVGVAGLDRLLRETETLRASDVIIAVAGMEGALPSVVAGLVDCPVIAVPTSVGYGSHFDGLVPLLAMLNSCAPGVAVVNVDNGFGAAALAKKMLRIGSRGSVG